ncbi:MAG: hypothetical protein R6U26_03065, partial [Candidatus Undinarchaeales archaeon]
MNRKGKLILMTFLIVLVLSAGVFAYNQQDAEEALSDAEECIQEMKASNLSTQRVEDLHGQAQDFYEAQVLREEQNITADYAFVVTTSNQICELKTNAFQVYDELKALEFEVESARESGINMEEIDPLYTEAVEAFESERYGEADALISETYDKISEVEATTTKIRAFYEASTKTLRGFLERNWEILLTVVVFSIIAGLILKNRISIMLLERHIRHLELEKETIYDLIKNVQRVYFDEQDMSESEYLTKIKKFKQIIRDINRQIPLLKTELEKKKGTFSKLKKKGPLAFFKKKEKKDLTKAQKKKLASLAERLGGVKVSKKKEKESEKSKKTEEEKDKLGGKSYRKLQKLAKKHDIKANQKKETLVKKLKKKRKKKPKKEKKQKKILPLNAARCWTCWNPRSAVSSLCLGLYTRPAASRG